MGAVEEKLKKFDSISLEEMDSKSLMDRTDTKFLFHIEKLPDFLDEVSSEYSVLEVNSTRLNNYETIYYDTEDFKMYLQHQNGKLNRHKVRHRTYLSSHDNFFEIKFKSNKNKTIKKRIETKEFEKNISGNAKEFLENRTNFSAENLVPKLWINYSRITLVNKTLPERLTIDLNLEFKNEVDSKKLPEIVIAELKQSKRMNTPFINVMRKHHVENTSISKYCFGVIFLYEHIKKNRFKRNLLTLKKICHDSI